VRSSWLTVAARTFSITIGDPDGGPLSVDYKVDSGAWSEPRGFASPGSYSLLLNGSELEANLNAGKHEITFRVSDGFSRVTAAAAISVNSPPTIDLIGSGDTLSIPETGSFVETVAFALGDADGDRLMFLYAIDSAIDWRVYNKSVVGKSVSLRLSENWPSPRFSVGNHTLLFRVSDNFDASGSITVNVRVGGDGGSPSATGGRPRPSTAPSGPVTATVSHPANAGSKAFGAGAIAGIAAGGLGIVIGAIAVVICFRARRRGSEQLSSTPLTTGWFGSE
jgi:hypothetical protein